jgi:hypothetical protein
MNEPKPKRGGRRPNAGQPKKLGGWERKQVSLSKPALAQLQRIHPKLTTAIEIAAQHYEETNKMNAKQAIQTASRADIHRAETFLNQKFPANFGEFSDAMIARALRAIAGENSDKEIGALEREFANG